MSKLFWRTFILPQLRHPSLFITGVLGVAFCVSLFYSMGVASEKALKSIEQGKAELLPYPKHPQLSSFTLQKRQGRLSREDVRSCFQKAHLGFVCKAQVQLNLKSDQQDRSITVIGIKGGFANTLTPIFSSDLPDRLSMRAQEINATTKSDSFNETIVLDHRDLSFLLKKSVGFDRLEIAAAPFLGNDSVAWEKSVRSFAESLGPPQEFLVQLEQERVNERMNLTSSYRLNLLILTATSILVAGLFLWNIAALQIHNRRRSLAILRQQGIDRRKGLKLVVFEQIFVAMVGAVLGLFVGVFLERVVSALTLKTLSDIYTRTTFIPEVASYDNAVAALIFGVLFYLVACSQLSVRLLFVTPQDLRQKSEARSSSKATHLLMSSIAILSFLVAFYAPNFKVALLSERAQPYAAYLAAFFVFVLAFSISTPALWLTRQFLKLVMKLNGFRRFPSFTIASTRFIKGESGSVTSIATVASALTLSLGIALMVVSFRGSVTKWFDQVFLAEVVVNGKEMNSKSNDPVVPDRSIALIQQLNHITGSDCLVKTEGQFSGLPITAFGISYDRGEDRRTPMVFMDAKVELSEISQFEARFAATSILINEPLANRYGLEVGDSIEVEIGSDGQRSFEILGVVQDYGSEGGYVMLPRRHSQSLSQIEGCHSMRIYGKNTDPAQLVERIQQLDPEQLAFTALTTAKLRRFVIDTFNQTFAITDVMTLLAVILGGLALLVHVAQSTYDRKDEWLSLRRIGMSWRRLAKVALWDNIFVLSTGSLLGVFCGLILAWIMVFLINVKSFGWSFQMEPASVFKETTVVLVMFVSLLIVLAAFLTLRLIRPGERWQRWRE